MKKLFIVKNRIFLCLLMFALTAGMLLFASCGPPEKCVSDADVFSDLLTANVCTIMPAGITKFTCEASGQSPFGIDFRCYVQEGKGCVALTAAAIPDAETITCYSASTFGL